MEVDGSSEAAFAQSLDQLNKKMPRPHAHVFGRALQDIWLRGVQEAEAAQHEYTVDDYYRQIDGLTYKEVIRLADPTGAATKARYRAAIQARNAPAFNTARSPWPVNQTRPHVRGLDAAGLAQQQHYGGQGMNPSGTY